MQAHHMLGKAEANSASPFLGGIEWNKYALQLIGWDPFSVIFYPMIVGNFSLISA